MDTKEIRRSNLLLLIEENKTQAALSERSGVPVAYINQIVNRRADSSGTPRGMGHKTARQLEDKCLKPKGWMDVPHGEKNNEQDELLSIYSSLKSESLRHNLLEQARLIYKIENGKKDESPSLTPDTERRDP